VILQAIWSALCTPLSGRRAGTVGKRGAAPMSRAGRDALCLAVGAASTAVAVWLYWRRQPRQPLEPPAPLATRLPVLPAASLTDGAAAAAVRAAGVCVVHDVLSAGELVELGQRMAALTPRKMQNRRPQRWEHVHDPASEPFKRPAMWKARPVWPAGAARAAYGPRLAGAGGGLEHDRPLLEACGE